MLRQARFKNRSICIRRSRAVTFGSLTASARAGDCRLRLSTPASDAAPLEIRECFRAVCRRRAEPNPDCCEPRRYQDSAGALHEVARSPLVFCPLAPARVPSQPECLRPWAQAVMRGASLQARLDPGFGSTARGPTARALSAGPAVNGLQLGNARSLPAAGLGAHG